ncbi:MAG TPA: glycosyl hydrolase [Solirubrobacteraceae bacterium]|nr:glycosyl hydrolase [Solirubrobacteraceae bacterium]
MKRAVFLTLLATFCLAATPAAAKPHKPLVGFGEQNPWIFSDQHWLTLAKNERRYVRYVMPWDALRYKRTRATVDLWMEAAKYRHARVLLAFGHSARRHRQLKLPSRRQYRRQIRAVRRRYPFVRTFQTWNEANHGFQPTYRKPRRTGHLYDVLVKTCHGCVVTAPSVMLTGRKTIRWIKRFRRAAKRPVRIWAVHNHIDANRNTKRRTRMFLRNTHHRVWFTEVGAIWNRWMPNRHRRGWHKVRRYNHRTAVRAMRNIFKLARLNRRRVRRIYVYNWFGRRERRPRWDSGVVSSDGEIRRTFRTLRAQMRKYAR